MPADLLPCVEVEPSAPADRSIIWLHGLGADGHDFEPIVPELSLGALNIRVCSEEVRHLARFLRRCFEQVPA